MKEDARGLLRSELTPEEIEKRSSQLFTVCGEFLQGRGVGSFIGDAVGSAGAESFAEELAASSRRRRTLTPREVELQEEARARYASWGKDLELPDGAREEWEEARSLPAAQDLFNEWKAERATKELRDLTTEEVEDLCRYMRWKAGEFAVRVSAPRGDAGGAK